MNTIATLDIDRSRRRGFPEAVYCAGKTPDQCARIAAELRDAGTAVQPLLFTKANEARRHAIAQVLPDAHVDADAHMVAWPPAPAAPSGELVVVACAGTSDLPVAHEATLTARYLGRNVRELVDVGVAGLHRILEHTSLLERAGAIVVVAGMDGALPSVVAGLTPAPVIAVPTSVGYGAALGGITPLLAMLNACAPGVACVNIDNGYGAGHLAAQIAAPRTQENPDA